VQVCAQPSEGGVVTVYEDFVVNNPNGAIIDLSLLKQGRLPDEALHSTQSALGRCLVRCILDLYKRYGVTIPAGTCLRRWVQVDISAVVGMEFSQDCMGLTVDWFIRCEHF